MTVSLEPLSQITYALILPWRNSPAMRSQMYTQHEITPAEHRAWFERMQSDPTKQWYLCRDELGKALGVIYFTEIDAKQRTAFTGFYKSPDTPQGVGGGMAYAGLTLAFGDLGLSKINCDVFRTNMAVINFHKKCGFTEELRFSTQISDNENLIEIIRLAMRVEEWRENRERLIERIQRGNVLTRASCKPSRFSNRGRLSQHRKKANP
jgi:UDP-4-amino-4,6-dideoxy-N-acetyl-beta-L-altrosamine N-acetyltransferase